MHAVLLIARLVLAATFATAGLAKLADRNGTLEAVRGFGVPESLAVPVGAVLPLAELAAVVLLIASVTARAGGVIALALLLAFAGAITRSMARGETPDCHCFGQLHSAPAGPKTLVRNLVLAAIAVLVVAAGAGTSATRWIAQLSGSGLVAVIGGVLLTVLAAAAGSLVLSLLRRHGELLLRIEALEDALAARGIQVAPVLAPGAAAGLAVGSPAPEFELPDLDGERVSLRRLRESSNPVMLVFTDPGCGPCSALMPQLASWQDEHAGSLEIVLISRGDREANVAHASEHGVSNVLMQDDHELIDSYQVGGTPGAVLIAPDGTIASPVHGGADAINALVASRFAAPQLAVHRHEPELGRPAPDATVQNMDGEELNLSSVLDGPTAVLFWNPSCGFCQQMLPDLKALEAAPPAGAPSLLLISTGDAQSNRAMGLRTQIVLDRSFAAGSAFGASGTPSAVLVDEHRRIVSQLAVGALAVLALAGSAGPEPART
jgi:peroxiredoxin/uncharacterized membrane protein YphA (DoxX/SURF4 family)